MHSRGRAELAGIPLGQGCPVAVMGVLNVSPESFYLGSVRPDTGALLEAARDMIEAGALLLDVGARSTAPYLDTAIDETEETQRLGRAVSALAGKFGVPVSADTARAGPARVALEAGAQVVNDVSGLADSELARLVAEAGAGLIAMASPRPDDRLAAGPCAVVTASLSRALSRARAARIPDERIVLDPGIGFFREGPISWEEWDVAILGELPRLLDLGRPLCVGVSRKSFIGAITGRPAADDRLAGSLAATALAVVAGASLIRTHDVRETLDAVRVAMRIRAATGAATRGEKGP